MSISVWFRRGILVLLVLTGLFSAFRYWRTTLGMDGGGGEAIAAFQDRLEPVREALPFQRGIIGYLGEWDVPGGGETLDQQVEFLLAQNALAPLILQRGAAPEWTAAVLGPPSLESWVAANPGAYEVIPLGRGVYLLHRGGNQ